MEIGRILQLSDDQLDKHELRAMRAGLSKTEPSYACFPWSKLPEVIRSMLPCDAPKALVRIDREGDGLIVTLMPSMQSSTIDTTDATVDGGVADTNL